MLVLAAAVAVFASSVNSLALPAATSLLAQAPSPTVKLAYATYAGASSNGLSSFLGMRYAAPRQSSHCIPAVGIHTETSW